MDRIALRGNATNRHLAGMVELKMDEYDMDDLAGEIARTLAACQDLAEDDTLTGNDGGEIATTR